MWVIQSPQQRLHEVAQRIVNGLADGSIVPDPPNGLDPTLQCDEPENLPRQTEEDTFPGLLSTTGYKQIKSGPLMSLDERIVVEPLETEVMTVGGILLLDTAKLKPQRGRVLAVGPGKLLDNGKRAAFVVAAGDEIVYGKYAGDDAKLGAKDVKILSESDILAKVMK